MAATQGKKSKVDKHSPNYLVSDLVTPVFRNEMKKRGIIASSTILPSGMYSVSCRYEDREIVGPWLEENTGGGETHTCNDDRVGVSITKGIDWEEDANEVKEYFEDLSGVSITNIRKFQRVIAPGQQKRHWWVIKTETKTDLEKITSINTYYESRTGNRTTRGDPAGASSASAGIIWQRTA